MEISIAADGQQGVDALLAKPDYFDAVLMDVQMPVMDGYQATREIRKDARFAKLPIIAMTANAMVSDQEDARDAGMDDHVAKPIDIKELFETLGKWITLPEDVQQARLKDKPAAGTAYASKELTVPDLPGIDTRTGLQRAAGNKKLYLGILTKFHSSQADVPGQIEAALVDGDRATAERLAHTLKGVSGNVGADELQEAAKVLESAIRSGQDNVDSELEALRARLKPVLDSLAMLEKDESAGQGAAPQSVDLEQLQPLLKQLRALLEEDDADAVDVLDELHKHLAGSDLASLLEPVGRAIGEYDFELALEKLDELERQV